MAADYFFRPPLRFGAFTAAALIALLAGPVGAQTLAAIKARDALLCGVSEGIVGFSIETTAGWTGFDVDFCRALAAAVLGDPAKVRFVPLNAETRFAALQSGNIDVLSRNSTWTMSREVELKLLFPATTYYDGQGFIVRKARNTTSALELGIGAKVCVQSNTTTELNLVDFFRANDGASRFPMRAMPSRRMMRGAATSLRATYLNSMPCGLRSPRPTITPSCLMSFRRNRSARWCGKAMTSGSTLLNGRYSRWLMVRNSASRRGQSMKRCVRKGPM
jgi:extracellular solute-binding protein (family 3)